MNSILQAAYSMLILSLFFVIIWFLTSQNLIPKKYIYSEGKLYASLGVAILAILVLFIAIGLFFSK